MYWFITDKFNFQSSIHVCETLFSGTDPMLQIYEKVISIKFSRIFFQTFTCLFVYKNLRKCYRQNYYGYSSTLDYQNITNKRIIASLFNYNKLNIVKCIIIYSIL